MKGQGVKQDKAKAYQHFLQAAKGKHLRGIHNLAQMLEHGDGVVQNIAEALQWYEEAFKLGDQSVKAKIDALRNQLTTHYQGNFQSAANHH